MPDQESSRGARHPFSSQRRARVQALATADGLRAPARVQYHPLDAVDAEPRVPEAGVVHVHELLHPFDPCRSIEDATALS